MDFYTLLGVSKDASVESIHIAWKILVKKNHPDKFLSKGIDDFTKAEIRVSELNQAWSTLRDPVKRREYDSTLES
ncbi:MAG: J domain-containing protein [Candidatus Paceibacterota bacterium]